MSTHKLAEPFIRLLMGVFAIVFVHDIRYSEGMECISRIFRDSHSKALSKSQTWRKNSVPAVDEFVHEYQLQHNKIIEVTSDLKKKDKAIHSYRGDEHCRSSILEFSYMEDGNRVRGSVIVDIPDLGINYTTLKKILFYAKEKFIYQNVLPLMYQSWPYEKLSPNFYGSKESEILIIENLHESSYFVKDSLLDSFEECKLVFKSLAQFHALSIAHLNDVQYSVLRSLTATEILHDNIISNAAVIEERTGYTKQLLSRGIPSKMKEEIEQINENLSSILTLIYSPSENFNVVLHGWLKPRTVYFKRESGSLDSAGCKFVDFRISRRGSPVLDLMQYLISSVEFEVFKMHQDSLFSFYLEKLHETLAELKHSCQYDLNDLRRDLQLYRQYFILHLVYQLPIIRTGLSPSNIKEAVVPYDRALQSNTYFTIFLNWMDFFTTNL